jgi:hypothetical protein
MLERLGDNLPESPNAAIKAELRFFKLSSSFSMLGQR